MDLDSGRTSHPPAVPTPDAPVGGVLAVTVGPLAVTVAGATDIGPVRTRNEDVWAAFAIPGGFAMVVADGMGGEARGDLAARTAVDTIRRSLERSGTKSDLRSVIEEANAAVAAALRGVEAVHGGTTVVLAVVSADAVTIANVGDSRGYIARANRTDVVTEDQRYVAGLVREGVITAEAARTHPMRAILNQALNGKPITPEVLHHAPLAPGDRLLLCSDGAWAPLDEWLLETRLAAHMPVEGAAAAVVHEALRRGTDDNTTVVVAGAPPGVTRRHSWHWGTGRRR